MGVLSDARAKLDEVAKHLSGDDFAALNRAKGLLADTEGFYREFSAAVTLVENCIARQAVLYKEMDAGRPWPDIFPEMDLLGAWMRMAGNTAALSVYHIDDLLKEYQGCVGKIDALKQANGRRKLETDDRYKAPTAMLSEAFPNLRQLRDAVGHLGEVLANRDQHRGDAPFISATFFRDTYVFTKDGSNLGISINAAARDALHKVLLQPLAYFDAFLAEVSAG